MIISYCCTADTQRNKVLQKVKTNKKYNFFKASFEALQSKLFSVQLSKHINFVNKKVILDTTLLCEVSINSICKSFGFFSIRIVYNFHRQKLYPVKR